VEQAKLAIRIPRDVLDAAQAYARRHNTTLTRLVSAYLRRLGSQELRLADAPIVQRLSGVLAREASIDDYYIHLEEKGDST
jgi:hypothetical protein